MKLAGASVKLRGWFWPVAIGNKDNRLITSSTTFFFRNFATQSWQDVEKLKINAKLAA